MDMSSKPAETSNNNNEISRGELSTARDDAATAPWRPEMLDVWERNAHLTLPEPPAPVRYFLHAMAPALYEEVVL